MPQLPIIAVNTPPAATAQTAAPTDTATPAETFEAILARQHADDPQTPAPAPTNSGAGSASDQDAATIDTAASEQVDDVSSTLPGDMLAALLPAGAKTADVDTKTAETTADTRTTADPVTGRKNTKKAVPDEEAAATDTASAQPGIAPAAIPVTPDATPVQESRIAQKPQTARALQEAAAPPAPPGTQRPPSGTEASLDAPDDAAVAPPAAPVLNLQEQTAASDKAALPAPTLPIGARAGGTASRAQNGAARDGNAAKTDASTFSATLTAAETRNATATALGGAMKIATPDTAPDPAQPTVAAVSTPATPHAGSAAQVSVNTPMARQGQWGEEFNQKITWLVTQRAQSAELHLNPPHLGPLSVTINVNGDQASALFTSPHAAVRDAVEQALPKLRDMLADSGITLGNANVSDQSQREQQAAWQSGLQRNGSAAGNRNDFASTDTLPAGVGTAPSPRRHHGMVDTFA